MLYQLTKPVLETKRKGLKKFAPTHWVKIAQYSIDGKYKKLLMRVSSKRPRNRCERIRIYIGLMQKGKGGGEHALPVTYHIMIRKCESVINKQSK